jgi:hypothetical protein
MSGVNPYIPPTCPSQRFCKNHKYNTEGLFTGFYNENSSVHCGQENIKMPRYQKLMGGSALPGNVYVNVSPGEQLEANNGVEFTDINTDSSMAGMRTGFVDLQKYPSLNLYNMSANAKKEGFSPDYSSRPGGYEYGNMSTSSTAVKPLLSSMDSTKPKGAVEKFCSACTSPWGCAVLSLVIVVIIIFLLIKLFNQWSRDKTGRTIFKGGSFNSVKWEAARDPGNMNIMGGGEGEDDDESASNEFAII